MRSVATVRIWAESEYHARDQFYSRGLVSDTDPTLLDIPSRDGKLSFEFVVTGRRRAD